MQKFGKSFSKVRQKPKREVRLQLDPLIVEEEVEEEEKPRVSRFRYELIIVWFNFVGVILLAIFFGIYVSHGAPTVTGDVIFNAMGGETTLSLKSYGLVYDTLKPYYVCCFSNDTYNCGVNAYITKELNLVVNLGDGKYACKLVFN